MFGLPRKKKKFEFDFQRIDVAAEGGDGALIRARNLLAYTKTSGVTYSGYEHPAGYHTIEFRGETLVGQRNPRSRLASVPYDFAGKTVLDVGTNQGGMLHALSGEIKWGVGTDYDYRLINAANFLRNEDAKNNLSFYVHDLENDPLDLIRDMIPAQRVDICFLLAVCMWIGNWRDVIRFCAGVSDAMLFESNGTKEQQSAQIAYLETVYGRCDQLTASSDDDAGKKERMMFFCRGYRQR